MELSPKARRRLRRFLWALLDTLRALAHFILSLTLFGLAFALVASVPVVAGLALGGHAEALAFVKTLRPAHWIILVCVVLLLVAGVAVTRKQDEDD